MNHGSCPAVRESTRLSKTADKTLSAGGAIRCSSVVYLYIS